MDDIDWDDAYDNSGHIPGAADYQPAWTAAAQAFRDRHSAAELDIVYGPDPRNRLDLFLPQGTPLGLAVFVHGGYWLRFDKSVWSHFAQGPLAQGWAVAMPSYRLAPEARIAEIVVDVGQAIETAAARVAGPIRLAGHSAGGHLVTRMAAQAAPVAEAVKTRFASVLSISGLHDLRPLMNTTMNDTLRLDQTEARAESPVLLPPVPGLPVTAWVGGAERPEFLRQSRLLEEAWPDCTLHIDADKHHFDVIAGLDQPDSPITRAFLGS